MIGGIVTIRLAGIVLTVGHDNLAIAVRTGR
jgi:hypothetical protein